MGWSVLAHTKKLAREKHFLEQALALASEGEVGPDRDGFRQRTAPPPVSIGSSTRSPAVPSGVAPSPTLLGGRPDVQREHLATLRAVLDHPGLAEAAAALGVHRNTVAYRVRRVEALTGWRLSDPELRLPLALALRLVQTG